MVSFVVFEFLDVFLFVLLKLLISASTIKGMRQGQKMWLLGGALA